VALNLRMVVQADAASAKAALDDTARGVQGISAATDKATTSSRASATAAQSEARARQQAAQANRAYTATTQQAAGATGNLVAQFNDIGIMLAAGQNPLQLAIQQGPQITQVFGNQGAAGAANLLKTAFVSMLSPINLVTVGAIAAGAAMIQWLTGADAQARTLEDQIGAVNDAVKSWRDESGKSFEDLRSTFGTLTPEIVAMQRELNQLRIADILREADAASRQLSETIGSGMFASVGGDLRRLFLESGITLGTSQIQEFRAALDAVGSASGLREQLDAVQALRERFADITGGIQSMSEGQRAFYGSLLDTEAALRAAAAATGEIANETDAAASAAANLEARARAVVGAIASADGSRLVAAFSAAFPVASQLLGMAQGIIATIGAARRKAASADMLGQMAIEFSPGGQNLTAYGGRTPGGTASQNALAYRNRPVVPVFSGGGGGAGAALAEANALQELITSLEGEIEALRVQDPIQKEMLKHREALTGATEAEKQKVEELIATREREQLLMEGAKARAEFFEDLGNNALEALIVKGESFNEVLKNIARSLIQAALQAALFGSGPFGSLFGGKSIIGQIFPALGGKAEGGMVYGPGSGTSDSIPTMLSNGEYVVNAKATARNRHLLEAINAGGRVGGFAAGGMVGGDSRRATARGTGGGPSTLVVDVRGAQGNTEIQEMVRRGVQTGLQLYDREALPRSVQRVSNDSRRVN
jgi:hypothetical protein